MPASILQVDDAVLANMYDELVQHGPARTGSGPSCASRRSITRCAAFPRIACGITCASAAGTCRTSPTRRSRRSSPLILKVRAGAYAIEAANVRHEHEWRVWQTTKLPQGRMLIPGVVTHHTTTVEHPRLVADRIVQFAKLVGRENVIAGTDCGFAQLEITQRVHPQVMWAKLNALSEGARLASQELWGIRLSRRGGVLRPASTF